MLLAQAGILQGRPAITHHAAVADLEAAGAKIVRAAGQNNGYTRSEDDSGGVRIGEKSKFLGQHITSLEIGDQEDIRFAGDGRYDSFRIGCFATNCIIEG